MSKLFHTDHGTERQYVQMLLFALNYIQIQPAMHLRNLIFYAVNITNVHVEFNIGYLNIIEHF